MNQDLPIDSTYVCPRTRERLRSVANGLTTGSGGLVYAVTDGIPQFLRFSPAEDTKTEEQLRKLNQIARESGWRAGLDAVYGADPRFIRYVTETERTSFLNLLPLRVDSDVLEIGPGLGQITTVLARRVRSVKALEIVSAQAEFAAERCRQEKLDNTQFAIGGDDCRLPYANESFDLVVLNLVFEWCAMRCTDENFEDVQRRLLDEMFRVLKPGGSLYLATKNRFSFHNLVGAPDEHCHWLRFGSALPKWLRTRLMKRMGHDRPLGVLYSHNELQRLLHRAGFNKTVSFWATPEMRYPTHYVPTDAASVQKARREPGFLQGNTRSSRWLMQLVPARWVKHFTPGLAFLATKASEQSSIL